MDSSSIFPVLAGIFLIGSLIVFWSSIWSIFAGDEKRVEAIRNIDKRLDFDFSHVRLPADILKEAVPGSAYALLKENESGNLYCFFSSNTLHAIQDELVLALDCPQKDLFSFYLWPVSRPLIEDQDERLREVTSNRLTISNKRKQKQFGVEYACFSSLPYKLSEQIIEVAVPYLDYLNNAYRTQIALKMRDDKIWLRSSLNLDTIDPTSYASDALSLITKLANITSAMSLKENAVTERESDQRAVA